MRKTLTVPEAGELYFGMGKQASYAAAAKGVIPTIRLDRSLGPPWACGWRGGRCCRHFSCPLNDCRTAWKARPPMEDPCDDD